MKRLILLLLFACLTAAPAPAVETPCGAETGYFLTLRQKGQLIWWGRIRDAQDRWYDVWICPGYVPPSKHLWSGLRWTGANLSEYAHADKYRSLGRQSRSCWRWAFRDCFWRFTVKGVPRAWKDEFREARDRSQRRVFGWWLAYPWATLSASVNTVVRVPVGLVGTAAGVAGGTVIVPGYHLVNSSVKAAWHLGVDTLAIPAAGYAWNTVVTPPLALAGQKPAPQRADGFWVRIVTPGEIRRAELENLPVRPGDAARAAEWCRLLWIETSACREERARIEIETRQALDAAYARQREQQRLVDQEESARVERLAADPRYRDLAADIRRICPDSEQVSRMSGAILEPLTRDEGLSPLEAQQALYLFRRVAGERPPDQPAGKAGSPPAPAAPAGGCAE